MAITISKTHLSIDIAPNNLQKLPSGHIIVSIKKEYSHKQNEVQS